MNLCAKMHSIKPRRNASAQWGSARASINQLEEAHIMLKWALVFLVISLIAGVFGFTGIAAGAAAIAKVLFFLALLLFVVFLVLGLTIFKSIT
jgi:uncharacterized membrane protein YtjA (UPF0391 family)